MVMAFSEPCERNKQLILDILTVELHDCSSVLEVASGTGQHAVHFANGMPGIQWQPTDQPDELPTLAERITAEAPQNVRPPLSLDVRDAPWQVPGRFDAVFSANSLHIMSWNSVRHFFRGMGQVLDKQGMLCVYGPFLYEGIETAPSNVCFDQWLQNRDVESGIRKFSAVNELADAQALRLKADYSMPANNHLLVWQQGK